jgi:hypothetical protein
MLHFTSNNDQRVSVPGSWEECSVRIYQDIERACPLHDDPVKIFSVMTRTSYTGLLETAHEDLEAAIYQATAFIHQTQSFRSAPLPKAIKLRGRNIILPTELQRLTIGQNFQIRQAMEQAKKKEETLETLLSLATAVFLQPIVDGGEWNYTKAKELEQEILELNIFEIYPIGFFFLSKLNNSGPSGLLYWLRNLTRSNRRLPSSLKLNYSSRSQTSSSSMVIAKHTDSSHGWFNKNPLMRLCHFFSPGNSRRNIKPAPSRPANK